MTRFLLTTVAWMWQPFRITAARSETGGGAGRCAGGAAKARGKGVSLRCSWMISWGADTYSVDTPDSSVVSSLWLSVKSRVFVGGLYGTVPGIVLRYKNNREACRYVGS